MQQQLKFEIDVTVIDPRGNIISLAVERDTVTEDGALAAGQSVREAIWRQLELLPTVPASDDMGATDERTIQG